MSECNCLTLILITIVLRGGALKLEFSMCLYLKFSLMKYKIGILMIPTMKTGTAKQTSPNFSTSPLAKNSFSPRR